MFCLTPAEKPGGLFSEYGAPVPGASDEKPGGLFSTPLMAKAEAVSVPWLGLATTDAVSDWISASKSLADNETAEFSVVFIAVE